MREFQRPVCSTEPLADVSVEKRTRDGVKTMTTAKLVLEPLLTFDEAARILRRSHWTLRRDAQAGRIRVVRIGNALKIEQSEIRRIMNEGLAPRPRRNPNSEKGPLV
jgi:excisionase family DNA binding protein